MVSMSSKIKALNEEDESLEEDPETNGKPLKEAQEELALSKYKLALQTLADGAKKEGVNLLEEILIDPYNYSDNIKQLSPAFLRLQLGCLTALGNLYRDGICKDLERCKLMYERAIYFNQTDNISSWYRLGKVCFEIGDLHSAHTAFGYTLHLRPGHWGSLEHIVTTSYAIGDYQSCLNYCEIGLTLDAGFFKGNVFCDLVYKINPDLKISRSEDLIKTLSKSSPVSNDCQQLLTQKYLEELTSVQGRYKQRCVLIKQQICIPTPKLQFILSSLSLVEVVKEVLLAYEQSLGTLEFHKAVDVTWALQDGNVEPDDLNKLASTEESQTEEESQFGIRRSRSSSDDKENNTMPTDSASQQDADAGEKDKNSGDIGGENQQQETQQIENEEKCKKKNRRDVKWWQMEGKRRSQRVRGHLMPVSPDKAKKENSFTDQLKNLIPASLLGDDGSTSERESAKTSEKAMWCKKTQPTYFGSKEEEAHAKQLLGQMSGINLTCIIANVIEFLTLKIKFPWPSELRELFLCLYHYYRLSVSYSDVQTYERTQVIKDAYLCISFIEVVIEKFRADLISGEKELCIIAAKEVFFLEECMISPEPLPLDLHLRIKWATVRRLLQLQTTSNDDVSRTVCSILSEMEVELRKEPITVWTLNEVANLICIESVCEKAVGIAKMQNSQVVTDLYRNQEYESLIGVLQSCINFLEIEKRDLSDIYYYTVALHHTNNSDCIHHCLNLINQSIRFQDNNSLSESLVLLEDIWEKMNSNFTLNNKRSTVGSLLKILVACERKPPCQESILSVPWCLLHSVMYSLEIEEPAFYLEEDAVPNSVLLLQMAHECMSRTEKCCIDNGKLMLYTMKEILKVKKRDEYFAFEETRLCMEQAIFCLYSHPSKKSKVKNLKDHNSVGTTLTWEMCPTLYQYYCPCDLPEFDSFGSIGTEVESLFQRFLEIMPPELNPVERQKRIQTSISVTTDNLDDFHSDESFPKNLYDIYYLIGDFYFKSKEWSKAVTYYTWDLAVSPTRFDSWAAIALCMGESINTTLNTADVIEFKDLLSEAQSTAYCFRNALKLDPSNIKLRIEFGSFVYAMHAYCSRLMKQQATDIDMNLFNMIEKAKEDFLNSSYKCFDLTEKNPGHNESSETVEEELWIHHYMLGKISEKMLPKEDAEEYLKQYELAGKLLHDQGAPYPAKMNYYSPPELAIEALEIYYRVHASILTLVEGAEYCVANEKFYLQFLKRQENSPFIKCKLSKGDGGDNKKGRKTTEDTASKKDMAEITLLLNDLIDQAEKLVDSGATKSMTSSATSSTTTEDESSSDSVKSNCNASSSQPAVSSFSLSEFRKRLQEKEERAEKIATEAKKAVQDSLSTSPPSVKNENIYEGLDLENNHFYTDFKSAKYGAVISLCLKAMEECISRYPSHFKSYYRLAYSYTTFIDDAKRAREYLMGSTNLTARKISGLFGERKPTNFFNGIWRNPIDDVDRPGSFSYHMNKAMQLLLDVLSKLNDHQLLADIAIYLTKVPDNEKKYLSNPDREMFCQQAWNCSITAVKRKTNDTSATDNFNELGVEIFDTYTKFHKHNPRGHSITSFLHEVYRKVLINQGVNDENVTVEHALRYFSTQHMLMKQTSSRSNAKGSGPGLSGDSQKSGDGAPARKRGRRGLRQASQETTPTLPVSQDLDAYSAAFAAALQSGIMPQTMVPLLSSSYFTGVSTPTGTSYPTMHIESMQAVLNPLLSLKHIEGSKRGTKTPPPAHDTPKSSKSLPTAQASYSGGFPPATPVLPQSQQNSAETSDKERNGSSKTVEQTRPKPVARKLTKPDTPTDTSKYPPPTPVQSIRINTSPYKAQTTAVEQPPQFSYTKKTSQPSSVQPNERKDPPAAHCHTTPKRSPTTPTKNGSEVEVIDLTVKTPEKDKDKTRERSTEPQQEIPRSMSGVSVSTTSSNTSSSNTSSRTAGGHSSSSRTGVGNPIINPRIGVGNIITSPRTGVGNPAPLVTTARTTVANPVSRTGGDIFASSNSCPKPPYVDLRALAMNPIPSLPNHPPIAAGSSSAASSSRAVVTNTRPPPHQRPKLMPTRPIATSKPNAKPGPLIPRPTVINRNPPAPSTLQSKPYPLPPKKKHQMIFANPPPPMDADEDDDDIVEVICLE